MLGFHAAPLAVASIEILAALIGLVSALIGLATTYITYRLFKMTIDEKPVRLVLRPKPKELPKPKQPHRRQTPHARQQRSRPQKE